MDDCSQIVAVRLELLEVHQQVVSEFWWFFAQHHADFHVVIQLLTPRGSRRRPPDVSHAFHVSSNFARLSPIPGCNTACNIANLRPAVYRAFSATNCLQTWNPFLFGTRCTSLKHRPVVKCRPQGVQCVAQRSDEHGGLVSSRCNIRHRLRFCVLQRFERTFFHKSEAVLELESELQPGSLTVVVRGRSCSKFQYFCNVRRH